MDDFNFLVQETFKYAESVLLETNDKNTMPESSGVFYKIEKNLGTLLIRAISSDNLSSDYAKYENGTLSFKKLKLEDLNELRFFECDSLTLANSIVQKLCFKRYPIKEEHVLNISDPGDSWWARVDQDSIEIYLGLKNTLSIHKLRKLGPLGEIDETLDSFTKLRGYFKMFFPVHEYSSSHGVVKIKSECDLYFESLKNLLCDGEISLELLEKMREFETESDNPLLIQAVKEANFYLSELATLRLFWLDIELQIE